MPGLTFYYGVRLQEKPSVGLSIDTAEKESNKAIFDTLRSKQSEIEESFGKPLTWSRFDDGRASWVWYTINMGGLKDAQPKWPEIQDAMIDAMARLSEAFKPYIDKLHESFEGEK